MHSTDFDLAAACSAACSDIVITLVKDVAVLSTDSLERAPIRVAVATPGARLYLEQRLHWRSGYTLRSGIPGAAVT